VYSSAPRVLLRYSPHVGEPPIFAELCAALGSRNGVSHVKPDPITRESIPWSIGDVYLRADYYNHVAIHLVQIQRALVVKENFACVKCEPSTASEYRESQIPFSRTEELVLRRRSVTIFSIVVVSCSGLTSFVMPK
jgi:hypothetical protein